MHFLHGPARLAAYRTRQTLKGVAGVISLLLIVMPVQAEHSVQTASQIDACDRVGYFMARISEIRGRPFLRNVQCVVRSRKAIGEIVARTIRREITPQQLKFESVVLKTLGFISPEYDYLNGLLKLYQSQLGGLYDPLEEQFVVADWIPPETVSGILAHELTHALQDQHYGLRQLVDFGRMNGDELSARMSLVEGEATLLGSDVERARRGDGLIRSDAVSPEITSIEGSLLSLPYGTEHPPALQYFLSFPYTYGVLFVHSLMKQGGYEEISNAFSRPPRTSEEILHPEKWKNRAEAHWAAPPTAVALGDVSGASILHDDQLGEYGIRVLARIHLKDESLARTVSEGWDGDKVVVYRESNGRKKLVWFLWWRTQSDRDEFRSAFSRMIDNGAVKGLGLESGTLAGRFPYFVRITGNVRSNS